MQDEHSVSGGLTQVMDDRRRNDPEQAEGGYIICGCVWCKDDPEAAYDYKRLQDESRDLEALIQHLQIHLMIRRTAQYIISS